MRSRLSEISRDALRDIIVDEARDKAVFFGLMRKNVKAQLYAYEEIEGHVFAVEKRVVAGGHSRLDLLSIDNEPVGTVISTFLLTSYANDVLTDRRQVTLEVMNNNSAAWRLYERVQIRDINRGVDAEFRLLSKEEILRYAAVRGKTIGKWRPLETPGETERTGVQWKHVPDFGSSTGRWSTNRIYLLHNRDENFLLNERRLTRFDGIARALACGAFHGQPIMFLYNKVREKVKR